MSNAPLTYNRQIDGLRFYAVMGVLVCHFVHFDNWFLQRLPVGQGVDLFFVISGYLITRILLQNKEAIGERESTKKQVLISFYLRRSLRIFPIYYLTIFLLLAIDFQNSRQLWPWLVSYTTNFFISQPGSEGIGSFLHLWSLAVEEQFYLVWPFLILFLPKKYIEKVIVAVIIASVVFKINHCIEHGYTVAINALTISCADSLGLGSLLGYWTLY
jgi:peptidoglycan/LPS O-acetylase OafA/YrhL